MRADVTVDARGTLCPIPIIRAAEMMRSLRVGQVLEVLATDVAVLEDLPAWCHATGHEFCEFEIDLPIYRGYARCLH
ncbi:MAG: sulfurtransferase TusA family protein [Chloroflexi bacterium]|nr:sulfurtransferase TusA family protein [Chloroflexota bacterium]